MQAFNYVKNQLSLDKLNACISCSNSSVSHIYMAVDLQHTEPSLRVALSKEKVFSMQYLCQSHGNFLHLNWCSAYESIKCNAHREFSLEYFIFFFPSVAAHTARLSGEGI